MSAVGLFPGVAAAEDPDACADAPAVELDALFTYSIGNGSAVGALAHVMVSFELWRTSAVLGTLEVGGNIGYVNEPIALQPWMFDSATTGTTHKIPFAATVGHSFRFGQNDRYSLGVHQYLGATHWISRYRVRFPTRGIEGESEIEETLPDIGAFLRFTARPHDVVGFALQLGAPYHGISADTVVLMFRPL